MPPIVTVNRRLVIEQPFMLNAGGFPYPVRRNQLLSFPAALLQIQLAEPCHISRCHMHTGTALTNAGSMIPSGLAIHADWPEQPPLSKSQSRLPRHLRQNSRQQMRASGIIGINFSWLMRLRLVQDIIQPVPRFAHFEVRLVKIRPFHPGCHR